MKYPEPRPSQQSEPQEHFTDAQKQLPKFSHNEYWEHRERADREAINKGEAITCPVNKDTCWKDDCQETGNGKGCRNLKVCWEI